MLSTMNFQKDSQTSMGLPEMSHEEKDATWWYGHLAAVKHKIPVERPLRIPEHYHEIDGDV